MDTDGTITNRNELYNSLDSFAQSRREEIDKRHLSKDTGLLKSYVVETAQHNGLPDIAQALRGGQLAVGEGESEIIRLDYSKGLFGYAEPLTARHIAIHSFVQNDTADKTIRNTIRENTGLDSLWLAGNTFQALLQQLIQPLSPHRSVNVKFEFAYGFSSIPSDHDELVSYDDLPEDVGEAIIDEDLKENRWAVSFVEKARRLAANLERYQTIDSHWRAIKMLRIPAQRQGGFDLWHWGKMTYRASSFREGNNYLRFMARVYEQATRAIEETVWLHAEPLRIQGRTQFRLAGLPVVFTFATPLSATTFQNFVTSTFERGQGPFRLWGNPIALGPTKVHVYGMDLHLWQQLNMELTPEYFMFLLPKGTCGNTVHRLMTNLQRYIDPAVTARVGETNYEDFILNAMLHTDMTDV